MKVQLKVLFLSGLMIFAASCAKTKDTINNVKTDTYMAKADLLKSNFHYVRTIEDADSLNPYDGGVPGFHYDLGVVKPVITEKALQFVSVNDSDGRPETPDVVAAFAISQQFDILRDQNDYGESTNKIVEDEKQPWQNRQYIRVDWSQNLIDQSTVANQIWAVGMIKESSVTMLTEPTVDKDGTIQFETQSIIEQGGGAAGDLLKARVDFGNPVSVKMRTMLMPQKASDFKMRQYDNTSFARFGFFRTEENYADPIKGFEDSNIQYRANIFNVCEPTGSGSCATNKIVYHLSDGFPDEYRVGARAVIAEWNRAFKVALDRKDDVVTLDESKTYPIGDIRTSMIAFYPNMTTGGLLGVSQTVNTNTTGETVAARATIYGDGLDYEKNSVSDLVDLYLATGDGTIPGCSGKPAGVDDAISIIQTALSGDKTIGNSSAVASAKTSAKSKSVTFNAQNSTRALISQDVGRSNANDGFLQLLKVDKGLVTPAVAAKFTSAEKTTGSTQTMFDNLLGYGQLDDPTTAKKNQLRLDAMGIEGTDYVDDTAVRYIEIFARKNPGLCANVAQFKTALMNEVAQKTFVSTLLHEMGHNFGLRHNFHGSADDTSLYNAKYAQTKAALAAGTPGVDKDDLDFYAYTSVMDYSSSFYEVQGGLGPYDIAAIRYGYNRSIKSTDAVTSKPYKFCTDHQIGEDLLCRRFDKGNTVNSAVAFMIDRHNRNYVLSHFRRNRADFDDYPRKMISSLVQNTLIPIRQVMDEFIYDVIMSPPAQDNDFGCDQEFFRVSIAAGEIANICDPLEAELAGVDVTDLSTYYRGLFKTVSQKDPLTGKTTTSIVPWKDPSTYIPGGFADLLYANKLAEGFFTSIIGMPEPGVYLVEPDSHGRPILTALAAQVSGGDPKLSLDQQRLMQLASDRGLDDPQTFVQQNLGNITEIKPGPVGKYFTTDVSTLAGYPQLDRIGYEMDKRVALRVLAIEDLGILKYDLQEMAGNAYLWPQGKHWTTNIIDKLSVQDQYISPYVVTTRAGDKVPAFAPASSNEDLRVLGFVVGLAGFTADTNRSFMDKLRVCDANDAKCNPQNGLPTVSFTDSAGSGVYKASQIFSGDSIAYDLLKQAKDVSDQRDAYLKMVNSADDLVKAGLQQLTAGESARQALSTALLANDTYKAFDARISAFNADKVSKLVAAGSDAVTGALLSDKSLSAWERAVLIGESFKDLGTFVTLSQQQPIVQALNDFAAAMNNDHATTTDAKTALFNQVQAAAAFLTAPPADPTTHQTPPPGALDNFFNVKTAPILMSRSTDDLTNREVDIRLMKTIMQDLSLN